MYVVHFVARRDSDHPVDTGVSAATALPDAIARTRARLKTSTGNPSEPRPIGFLIFDATGQRLLHREYLD
jgi:hypothetical protein